MFEYTLATFGEEQAQNLVRRVRAAAERASGRYPRSGRARPEFGAGMRSYPCVPYVIFYKIVAGKPTVIRVIHGHRDIGAPLMSLLIA